MIYVLATTALRYCDYRVTVPARIADQMFDEASTSRRVKSGRDMTVTGEAPEASEPSALL